LHPAAQSREVWLRFRGLPFARWYDGRVFFGINDAREELTPASRAALKHLVHDLEIHRHPLASDTRHALYRLQPERRLESIVREVRRQLQSGEIARYGYFQGVALQQAPPLVYLVAPALRFHPATDDLLKYLSPELEVARVGLAEGWRRGLHVVMRQ